MTKLLELFRQGLDTTDISEHLGGRANGWTEARVYNELAKEKEEQIAIARARPLIRYAGYDRNTQPWSGR